MQYGGTIDYKQDVKVYNLDCQDTSAEKVAELKSRGIYTIGYINAGASETWRPDHSSFPKEALGTPMDGWQGENWLNINHPAIVPIMAKRMDVCKQKGFQAVDADNVDGYTQESGFTITPEDQLKYIRSLADEAHKRGLAYGLKNNGDQVDQLAPSIDFAVNEQCLTYNECGRYDKLLASGKALYQIEYEGNLADICKKAPKGSVAVLAPKNLDGPLRHCLPNT